MHRVDYRFLPSKLRGVCNRPIKCLETSGVRKHIPYMAMLLPSFMNGRPGLFLIFFFPLIQEVRIRARACATDTLQYRLTWARVQVLWTAISDSPLLQSAYHSEFRSFPIMNCLLPRLEPQSLHRSYTIPIFYTRFSAYASVSFVHPFIRSLIYSSI